MSKKSERDAQLQKVRSARPVQSQRRADGLGPSAEKQQEAVRTSRKPLPRWCFWTLAVVLPLAGLSCLSGLISVIEPPGVLPPPPILPTLAPQIGIANQSFLPLKSVEYTCEMVTLTDQSGFAVSERAPGKSEKHTYPSLARGERVPLDCQSHLDPQGLRIKFAEAAVKVSYFHPGWPFRRHTQYRLVGEFDSRGFPLGWRVD